MQKSFIIILWEQRSRHLKKLHISSCSRYKVNFFSNTCYETNVTTRWINARSANCAVLASNVIHLVLLSWMTANCIKNHMTEVELCSKENIALFRDYRNRESKLFDSCRKMSLVYSSRWEADTVCQLWCIVDLLYKIIFIFYIIIFTVLCVAISLNTLGMEL